MGMPYGEVDQIAKMIPTRLDITLDEALAQSRELKQAYEQTPRSGSCGHGRASRGCRATLGSTPPAWSSRDSR